MLLSFDCSLSREQVSDHFLGRRQIVTRQTTGAQDFSTKPLVGGGTSPIIRRAYNQAVHIEPAVWREAHGRGQIVEARAGQTYAYPCLLPARSFCLADRAGHVNTVRHHEDEWFGIAAIFEPASWDRPLSFQVLLTTTRGDLALHSDLQPIVLDRSYWEAWMSPQIHLPSLRAPTPDGILVWD